MDRRTPVKTVPSPILQMRVVIIAGQNCVMVDTVFAKVNEHGGIEVKFPDKNIFQLKAQPREFAVDGILCEKGD